MKIKIRVLTKRLLIFFNLFGITSLLYFFIIYLNKAIVYEDSFILLRSPEINFLNWLFIPHNGHIILVPKFLSSVLFFLNFSPTTFFIPLGILIIFIALYFLWKLININSNKENNNKIIIFLMCSYFWISPWHWENIIWEFQFPWFIISSFLVISTFIFLNKETKDEFNIYEKLFLFLSPLIAISSSGAGICYVNSLFLNYLIRFKNKSFYILGVFLAYFLLITIKIIYKENNVFSFEIFNNLKYISAMLLTIFKAPISANNSYSYFQWVIPILSSLIFQSFLVFNINWKNFINHISFVKKFALITPIFFGIQFTMITSLTRGIYGIHQGVVSRYLTCLVLIPIGLLIIFENTNNINFLIDKNKFVYYKKNISSKLNTLYLIIIFCLILNATSFFQTIYESHVSANVRYENFKIFKESCLNRINPNKDVILEKNFNKLKNYHTTNIPPFPNVENLENYKNYVNSDLCDKTNFYFK